MNAGVRSRGFLAAAALATASACAHAPRGESPPPAPTAARSRDVEVGLASFYGKRFHGRTMASGARYDMRALTCAHPAAPFGTRLRVTDLETNRTVIVTVTDRGPHVPGRVVDLSLAAARALRMVDRGVARVRVERLPE